MKQTLLTSFAAFALLNGGITLLLQSAHFVVADADIGSDKATSNSSPKATPAEQWEGANRAMLSDEGATEYVA